VQTRGCCVWGFVQPRSLQFVHHKRDPQRFGRGRYRGRIVLTSSVDTSNIILELRSVLHVLTNRHNLFSIGRWGDIGGTFQGGHSGTTCCVCTKQNLHQRPRKRNSPRGLAWTQARRKPPARYTDDVLAQMDRGWQTLSLMIAGRATRTP
jgi:hypothetical protein